MTWAVKMADARYDGYDEGYEKGISIGLTTGREEGISIGLERGRATGREEGAYQNKLETARNLLAMGLSPEQISQATKLPPETIAHLAATDGDMVSSELL